MDRMKNLILSAVILFAPSFALAVPKVSLTASGVYSKAFPQIDLTVPDELRTGMGGHGILEWRVTKGLALGWGWGLIRYRDADTGRQFTTNALDGLGRLIPWHSESGEFYLIGGLGYNTFFPDVRNDIRQCRYHGTAGLGIRQYFGSNVGVDLAAVYSVHSPWKSKLHSVDGRLGLTFGVGKLKFEPKEEEEKPTPTPEPTEEATTGDEAVEVEKAEAETTPEAEEEATPEPAEVEVTARVSEGPKTTGGVAMSLDTRTYKVRRRDSVWNIAWKPGVYNDPELYPILVRANPGKINADGTVDAGTELTVPGGLSGKVMSDARSDAWSRRYIPSRGRSVNYARYRKYQEMKEVIETKGATTRRVRTGDTLWDLAYKIYQDNWMWPQLYHANMKFLTSPNRIYPGQVLTVPNLKGTPRKPAPAPAEFVPAPQKAPAKVADEIKAQEEEAEEAGEAVEETADETAADEAEGEASDEAAEPEPTPQAEEGGDTGELRPDEMQ